MQSKTCVVTGASSVVGKSLATALRDETASIVGHPGHVGLAGLG